MWLKLTQVNAKKMHKAHLRLNPKDRQHLQTLSDELAAKWTPRPAPVRAPARALVRALARSVRAADKASALVEALSHQETQLATEP